MLAAMLPMPNAVQPLAAMMAPAAPRVWAEMLALKSSVRVEGGRARESGVVPIVAEDQAIYLMLVSFRVPASFSLPNKYYSVL